MNDVDNFLDQMVRETINQPKGTKNFLGNAFRDYHQMRRAKREFLKAFEEQKMEPKLAETNSYAKGYTDALALAIQRYCAQHQKVRGVTKLDIEAAFDRAECQTRLKL
jgi:hypothetical protein